MKLYGVVRETDDLLIATTFAFYGDTTGIYSVTTHESERKKGFATHLLTKIVEDSKERGIKRLTLMAGDLSKELYSKLGFVLTHANNVYAFSPSPGKSN